MGIEKTSNCSQFKKGKLINNQKPTFKRIRLRYKASIKKKDYN